VLPNVGRLPLIAARSARVTVLQLTPQQLAYYHLPPPLPGIPTPYSAHSLPQFLAVAARLVQATPSIFALRQHATPPSLASVDFPRSHLASIPPPGRPCTHINRVPIHLPISHNQTIEWHSQEQQESYWSAHRGWERERRRNA
jgi:hypothetical protein